MKFPVKLARSIVVCAFLAGISASALSEGKEYVILKNPIANADNSLIEIFSYHCTHC
ncbi:TPA: protein-disulfide isomerase, partial [Campylobacter jejuni]|nr:protein-disulfide isomerase [Campylobacter jejuni]